jgi:predicted MPP superfamily phosphohydrolase
MRLQLASDLHVEFLSHDVNLDAVFDEIVKPSAPYLALCGDIGYAFSSTLERFLTIASRRFQEVLYVAGNHEYYVERHSIKQCNDWIDELCLSLGNVHFMNNRAVSIDGVTLLGTTLWSDIQPQQLDAVELTLNDYRLIVDDDLQPITVCDTMRMHHSQRAWLAQAITDAPTEQPLVVLTHHTPAMLGTADPRYDRSPISSAFSTDLSYLLQQRRRNSAVSSSDVDGQQKPRIDAWLFGHTHYCADFKRFGTRLVANQRGYPSDVDKRYRNNCVVDVQ